jgi:prepilin-type N-terminal cleavage/methylation domain-containing protein
MKKAFSLIELLIVIVIIGVVYTLAIGQFQKIGEESSNITLENLKEKLQSFKQKKSVKLLCLDDCSSCDIFVDGEKTKTIEDFLDKNVKAYRYELSYGFIEAEKEVYFNTENVEENVCFSYEVDKSGVGNQVLVEFKNKFYDFSTYLGKTAVYASMQDAVQARENLLREVMK